MLPLAACVMLFSFSASAETLEEAWTLAQRNDPGLAAAQSDAEAARLDVQAAKGERWPTLMASGTFTQMRDAPAFSFGTTALPCGRELRGRPARGAGFGDCSQQRR